VNLATQPVMNVDPEQDPDPLMTVSRGVALPLGLLQAVVLMVAIAIACVVLLRRHPPDDATPVDR
jgi:hypothetical protein